MIQKYEKSPAEWLGILVGWNIVHFGVPRGYKKDIACGQAAKVNKKVSLERGLLTASVSLHYKKDACSGAGAKEKHTPQSEVCDLEAAACHWEALIK